MVFIKRVVVADHEQGIVSQNRSIEKIVGPGVHWIRTPRCLIETVDLRDARFEHPLADYVIDARPTLVKEFFHLVDLTREQVGFVFDGERLIDVLEPASRALYWQKIHAIRVETVAIQDDYVVPESLLRVLKSSSNKALMTKVQHWVKWVEVADHHVGLLVVNGEFQRTLAPGTYAWFSVNRSVDVEKVDLRLQSVDVSGQEMLTRDKVSLRVNLTASYRIVDAVTTRSRVADSQGLLYREVQFAIRQVVAARTLDALLGNKDEMDRDVYSAVVERMAEFGINVVSVGIKDVILPGDMKQILNQVVEAEKVAQANVIRRREETSATRSALNTAKLMQDNPTLMRLKELEVVETITANVERLTVFGGVSGVVDDLLKTQMQVSMTAAEAD